MLNRTPTHLCRRRHHLDARPDSAELLSPTLWYSMALLMVVLVLPRCVRAQLPSDSHDTFVLSGTVVNSVTGEGISRAMVRVNGPGARTTFSDDEGHFQFEGLPPGRVTLSAQKPGYFSEQETSGIGPHRVEIGPNTAAESIKLDPMSAISGRVTDATAQPIEHIAVRLMSRTVRDGRKIWEPRGMSETNEDGHFRFGNLVPATYYLSVGPAASEQRILAAGEKPATGFPHLYYPGVPDLSSATPIQLSAGQQFQADFSLSPVPLYSVTGSITGQPPDQGVGLMTLTSSGDDILLPIKVNSELGTFSLDSIPAGSYILKAMANAGGVPLRGEQRISVAANLDNVHLSVAPTVSIPVVVHLQPHASGAGSNSAAPANEERPPVSVALLPTQPNAAEIFSGFERSGAVGGRNGMVLHNVESGSYTVNLIPQPPWYVVSATYGQTNALYDDITVASGQAYPLDITMRDDGASLSVSVRVPDNTNSPRAAVVIVPQPATKPTPHVLRNVLSTSTVSGLAPGEYFVFAFDNLDQIEYTNPDALAAYASQAAHVTLSANQQAQVSVDLIPAGKGE